ncbi:hypothetical protein PV10_00713 [Exophiala mesophila]|uniref:F-box domain-containing protein n=1 Tax=Exophiala mesophila TaxID=212818 RepID=A0A0D1ZSK4_EXOME|nr:uncharacterized protein PV10_00713 [Exophiala mesophila]KIV96899.1 hypothetical protein PV10_00713 [Exophiala mesophila]
MPSKPLDERPSSAFLNLPSEARFEIYSYLIPKTTFDIDLCTRRPQPSTAAYRSNISNLVTHALEFETITRSNGLHLLQVSRQTRSEVLSLLERLTVRFHCPKCYEGLLANLSYGLGVGVRWMSHVEIIFDCSQGFVQGPPHRVITHSFARFAVQQLTRELRRTTWLYYGRLDLVNREKWWFEPEAGGERVHMFMADRQGPVVDGVQSPPLSSSSQSPSSPRSPTRLRRHRPLQAGASSHIMQLLQGADVDRERIVQHHATGVSRERPDYRKWVISAIFDV